MAAGYAAMGSEAWKNTYEFTGTKLEQFPLPDGVSLTMVARLNALAARLQQVSPSLVAAESVPTRANLDTARGEWARVRAQMIFCAGGTRAIIERQVRHLTRLVDDLLDVSRIVRGKINFQPQAIEIAE